MVTSVERLEPVWDNILSFLVPPLPRPLCGALSATGRRDIRKDTLAILMRTSIVRRLYHSTCTIADSQAFNNHASSLLYRTVVTDAVHQFTANLGAPPAHPLIQSKSNLLRHTQHLYLEYSLKRDQPTYLEIMSMRNVIHQVGAPHVNAALDECIDEVQHVHAGLTALATQKTSSLPKLRRIAVGALFGAQQQIWGRFVEGQRVLADADLRGRMESNMRSCNTLVEAAFQRSPLEHWCQRGFQGPLSLPNRFKWLNPSVPTFTFHYTHHDTAIPVGVKHPTRWVFDQQRDHFLAANEIIESTSRSFDVFTKPFCASQAKDRLLTKSDLSLEVYGTSDLYHPQDYSGAYGTPFDLVPGGERELAKRTTEVVSRDLAYEGNRLDSIQWKPSFDSPSCQSCGWTYQQVPR